MIIEQLTYCYDSLEIIFCNGSSDVLDNIVDYFIDTECDTLTVMGINDDSTTWEDSYSLSSIEILRVSHYFKYRKDLQNDV